QTLKAGVKQTAEWNVLAKSARPGTDKRKQEVEVMLGIRRGNAFANIAAHHNPRAGTGGKGRQRAVTAAPGEEWEAPVLTTVASKGVGIVELVAALDKHHELPELLGKLEEQSK